MGKGKGMVSNLMMLVCKYICFTIWNN
jgi:hypothetical protein